MSSSSSFLVCRRWLRRLGLLAGVAGLVLFGAYLFRAPLLTGLAHAWVVNEPAAKADAIVILGGGIENRPFAAARLYHAGVATQILYMDVQLDPAEQIGIIPSEKEQTRQILRSQGVPESAMTAIGSNVASTYDESRAVRAWVGKNGAKSIVIPTDIFHTRRVRWLFQKELRGLNMQIYVVAVNPARYQAADWWQHEEGLIAFQNELVKSVYYWVKY